MARLAKWAAKSIFLSLMALLFANEVQSSFLKVSLQDADYRPTEFRDGLPTYVSLKMKQATLSESIGQFQLCTSCTVSYMFRSTEGFTVVSTE